MKTKLLILLLWLALNASAKPKDHVTTLYIHNHSTNSLFAVAFNDDRGFYGPLARNTSIVMPGQVGQINLNGPLPEADGGDPVTSTDGLLYVGGVLYAGGLLYEDGDGWLFDINWACFEKWDACAVDVFDTTPHLVEWVGGGGSLVGVSWVTLEFSPIRKHRQ